MKKLFILCLGLLLTITVIVNVTYSAEKEIPLGAIYPLTGVIADTGQRCRHAVETAVDLINNAHPGVTLPLAESAGLPNLGGARIKLYMADHQVSPALGKAEAERLITDKKVVGLVGCYNSGITKTASLVAERHGIPFVNGASSSTELHKQGYKTFFRVYSYDQVESKALFDCIKQVETKLGKSIKTYAIAAMVGEYGKHMGDWLTKFGNEAGYKLVERVDHKFGATDVSTSVLRLKAANPDVIFHACLLGDYLLFMKTYKEMNYQPKAIMSPCSGAQDPNFIRQGGKDADYVMMSQVFYMDRVDQTPNLKYIDHLYWKRSGTSLDGVVIGVFEAFMVLADAINRAGTTESKAVIEALRKTNIKWDIDVFGGVQFTEEGQNKLAKVVISQIIDGKHATVLPLEVASREPVWPMPSWAERK